MRAHLCVPLPDNFNKAKGLKLVAVTDCTQQRKAADACVNGGLAVQSAGSRAR